MSSQENEDNGIRDATFRIEKRESFHVVGIPQSSDTKSCLGASWDQFNMIKGDIPNRTDEVLGYGVQVYPPKNTKDGRVTYMASCEVKDLDAIPVRFFAKTLPATEYAVFTVTNWNQTVGRAWGAAYGKILPNSDYKPYLPFDFEHYDERAFVETPEEQVIEIWIPITRK